MFTISRLSVTSGVWYEPAMRGRVLDMNGAVTAKGLAAPATDLVGSTAAAVSWRWRRLKIAKGTKLRRDGIVRKYDND